MKIQIILLFLLLTSILQAQGLPDSIIHANSIYEVTIKEDITVKNGYNSYKQSIKKITAYDKQGRLLRSIDIEGEDSSIILYSYQDTLVSKNRMERIYGTKSDGQQL